MEKQKANRQQRAMERELAAIKKAMKARFSCKSDAEKAMEEFLQGGSKLHKITGQVVAEEITKRPSGRPKAGAKLTVETKYRLEISVAPPSKKAQCETCQKASTFILITTLAEEE